MIQRIQSIYLLLATVILGLLFQNVFNIGTVEPGTVEGAILSDGDLDAYDHQALPFLIGGAMLVFLASIFLFKNRGLQVKVVLLGLVIVLGVAGLSGFLMNTHSKLAEAAGQTLSIGLGAGNVILAAALGAMAWKSINKDEKLVQSMDRLR